MLDGRDIKDLNSFKVGDEFFPVGPRACHPIICISCVLMTLRFHKQP